MPFIGRPLAPAARVSILIETGDTNQPKEIVKFDSFTTVNTTLSTESQGTATVNFKNKKYQFYKGFLRQKSTRDEQEERSLLDSIVARKKFAIDEIVTFNLFLKAFQRFDYFNSLRKIFFSDVASDDNEILRRFLTYVFDVQDLIWIDSLGNDGKWYSIFTGIITSVSETEVKGKDPIISVSCKTPDRVLDYTPILTGSFNIFDDNTITAGQGGVGKAAPQALLTNLFGGKTMDYIFSYIMEYVNQYFTVFRPTETQTKRVKRVDNQSEAFFPLRFWNPLFEVSTQLRDAVPPNKQKLQFFDDSVLLEQNQVREQFSGGGVERKKHYQNLIRSDPLDPSELAALAQHRSIFPVADINRDRSPENLSRDGLSDRYLFYSFFQDLGFSDENFFRFFDIEFQQQFMSSKNTSYETAYSILQKMAATVQGFLYCDPKGNLRLEFPAFESFPNPDGPEMGETALEGNLDTNTNNVNAYASKLPNHGPNYFITKKDRSFQQSTFTHDEADIITKVSVPFNIPLIKELATKVGVPNVGFDIAPPSEILKFGLREFQAPTVLTMSFVTIFANELQDAYARAVRTRVNAKQFSTMYTLRRRPDLELNRNLVDVDRGLVSLITSINQVIVQNRSHETTINCQYTHQIGEPIPNPWRVLYRLMQTDLNSFDSNFRINQELLTKVFGEGTTDVVTGLQKAFSVLFKTDRKR